MQSRSSGPNIDLTEVATELRLPGVPKNLAHNQPTPTQAGVFIVTAAAVEQYGSESIFYISHTDYPASVANSDPRNVLNDAREGAYALIGTSRAITRSERNRLAWLQYHLSCIDGGFGQNRRSTHQVRNSSHSDGTIVINGGQICSLLSQLQTRPLAQI